MRLALFCPFLCFLLLFLSGFYARAGLPVSDTIPIYAINAHFTSGNIERLREIKALGFNAVRTDITWERIEKSPLVYDWNDIDRFVDELESVGLVGIFILNYSNKLYEPVDLKSGKTSSPSRSSSYKAYANWASAAAKRYKSRKIVWEIWNEPNHRNSWVPEPEVDNYISLVMAASKSMREVDPNVTLMGPALAGSDYAYFQKVVEATVGLFDYYSIHPYRLGHTPETLDRDLGRYKNIIDNVKHSAGERLVFGEFGYSSFEFGVSLDIQADYLERFFIYSFFNRVPISIWYNWKDTCVDPKDKECSFGIVDVKLNPKPAYNAAKVVLNVLRAVESLNPILNLPSSTYGYYIKSVKYGSGMVVWSDFPVKNHVVKCFGKVRAVRRDLPDKNIDCNAGSFFVDLDSRPSYFFGGLK